LAHSFGNRPSATTSCDKHFLGCASPHQGNGALVGKSEIKRSLGARDPGGAKRVLIGEGC